MICATAKSTYISQEDIELIIKGAYSPSYKFQLIEALQFNIATNRWLAEVKF